MKIPIYKNVQQEYRKINGHTLDIAPLRERTSLQKRSGMTRVVGGFHSFTCTLTHLSINGMNHTCLCLFPAEAGPIYWPRKDERLSWPKTTMMWKEFAQDHCTWQKSQLLAVQTVTPHWATAWSAWVRRSFLASNSWPLGSGRKPRRWPLSHRVTRVIDISVYIKLSFVYTLS